MKLRSPLCLLSISLTLTLASDAECVRLSSSTSVIDSKSSCMSVLSAAVLAKSVVAAAELAG